MKKRFIWLTAICIVIVSIVAATAAYASHFVNTVNQTHIASGHIILSPTATAPGTSASSTSPQTFQIVPVQTTASYSVYENLIFQNKPNNDAIGTMHSVQGNFDIQTGTSPLVAAMNVKVDLSTLQTDSQMRDNYVRQHTLETEFYPDATFV